MIPAKNSPVKLANTPSHGRAFFASRNIKAGEIILSDSPLLLYPASISSSISPFCLHCFRSLSSAMVSCPICTSALFCSSRCLSSALSSTHSHSICRAVSTFTNLCNPDLFAQVQFLLAAYILSSISPAEFNLLMDLDGGDVVPAQPDAIFLHSLLSPITGFSLEVTSMLIGKDRRNGFGLMEPFREGDGGERRVRVYGIYPNASFFNHDCLPNACRFEYLDREGDGNCDIVVRAIHDIPEGREVCLSYFPVDWGYKERQQRLIEDYGFRCCCDRCEVEKNWKFEDEEMEEGIGEEGGDGDDDFPHAYFFVRYVCDRENCGGTMAPLPLSLQGGSSGLIECNVCGRMRKEDEFDGDDGDGDSIMLDE